MPAENSNEISFQFLKTGLSARIVRGGLLAFGKYRIIDRPADMERERQLAIFQRPSSQPREQIRHESLLGDNFRHTLVVQLVGARDAYTPSTINIDSVAVDVDDLARNSLVIQLQVGRNKIERGRIILGGAEIIVVRQFH